MKPTPSIEPLRELLLAALQDCDGPQAERVRLRVRLAASAQELCHQRSEPFQLLAGRHCEARAKLILGVTEGYLPSTVGIV